MSKELPPEQGYPGDNSNNHSWWSCVVVPVTLIGGLAGLGYLLIQLALRLPPLP